MKERIRQVRKHFNLTQKEYADAIGVSTGFISLLETGRSGLSDENLESLCKKFHISALWMRDGIEPMESENPEAWTIRNESEAERREKEDGVAGRIRELRQTLHLSQKEFAVKISATRELVAMVEQRRGDASETLLEKIESGYGVNPNWLREGRGKMMTESAANLHPEIAEEPMRVKNESRTAEEETQIILEFLKNQPEFRSAAANLITHLKFPMRE